jgi:hypothetical protein
MDTYAIAKQLGKQCVTKRVVRDGDAVMFDIDDTLIRTDDTPIHEMISLARMCKNLGYLVIIITARPDFAVNHHHTQKQLIKYRIPYDAVYFVQAHQKTHLKKMTRLRYILSVGDMETDLGHSEYVIKLPNHFDPRAFSNITSFP